MQLGLCAQHGLGHTMAAGQRESFLSAASTPSSSMRIGRPWSRCVLSSAAAAAAGAHPAHMAGTEVGKSDNTSMACAWHLTAVLPPLTPPCLRLPVRACRRLLPELQLPGVLQPTREVGAGHGRAPASAAEGAHGIHDQGPCLSPCCAVLRCAGMEAYATACAAHSCSPSMCRHARDRITGLREAMRLSAREQQARTHLRCTVFLSFCLSVCLLHGLSAVKLRAKFKGTDVCARTHAHTGHGPSTPAGLQVQEVPLREEVLRLLRRASALLRDVQVSVVQHNCRAQKRAASDCQPCACCDQISSGGQEPLLAKASCSCGQVRCAPCNKRGQQQHMSPTPLAMLQAPRLPVGNPCLPVCMALSCADTVAAGALQVQGLPEPARQLQRCGGSDGCRSGSSSRRAQHEPGPGAPAPRHAARNAAAAARSGVRPRCTGEAAAVWGRRVSGRGEGTAGGAAVACTRACVLEMDYCATPAPLFLFPCCRSQLQHTHMLLLKSRWLHCRVLRLRHLGAGVDRSHPAGLLHRAW